MKKQVQTYEITIAQDVRQNMIYFRDDTGIWDKAQISDLPTPLLRLLMALDEGKRIKINLAEVEQQAL